MRNPIERFIDLRVFCIGLAVIAFSSCSSQTTSGFTNPQLGIFIQVDRLARPGVKEIFESFANHDTANRNSPYDDPTFATAVTTFATAPNNTANPTGAGRSAAIATAATNVFGVDELQINTNASGNAAYLNVETGGAGFGGRALTDDAMGLDLAAMYGSAFAAAGVASDAHENYCLAAHNVVPGAAATGVSAFPYLAPGSGS